MAEGRPSLRAPPTPHDGNRRPHDRRAGWRRPHRRPRRPGSTRPDGHRGGWPRPCRSPCGGGSGPVRGARAGNGTPGPRAPGAGPPRPPPGRQRRTRPTTTQSGYGRGDGLRSAPDRSRDDRRQDVRRWSPRRTMAWCGVASASSVRRRCDSEAGVPRVNCPQGPPARPARRGTTRPRPPGRWWCPAGRWRRGRAADRRRSPGWCHLPG